MVAFEDNLQLINLLLLLFILSYSLLEFLPHLLFILLPFLFHSSKLLLQLINRLASIVEIDLSH